MKCEQMMIMIMMMMMTYRLISGENSRLEMPVFPNGVINVASLPESPTWPGQTTDGGLWGQPAGSLVPMSVGGQPSPPPRGS